jgi:archaellum component FlaD/FlaE
MNKGDENTQKGSVPLEETELQAELAILIKRNVLPTRIAQKIGEKVNENGIKITRDQLYKLVEKIQDALTKYSQTSPSAIQSKKEGMTSLRTGEKTIANASLIQNTDMKKLVEEIEDLNQRMKIVEESNLEGVKGITGKLVKAKDLRAFDLMEPLDDAVQPLEQIPTDPESIVVIMKWLQYLVDKIGKNNLPDILGYYVDIGWISDNVRLDLIDYSKGLIEEPTSGTPRSSQLPTRDHLQSLLFIQKLKGVQMDERFIDKIERDMEKMAKSLNGYQVK